MKQIGCALEPLHLCCEAHLRGCSCGALPAHHLLPVWLHLQPSCRFCSLSVPLHLGAGALGDVQPSSPDVTCSSNILMFRVSIASP